MLKVWLFGGKTVSFAVCFPEEHDCCYENIRKLCTLSFMSYDATRMEEVRDHVDNEDKTVNDSFTVNGTHPVLINESGLYSLILSSHLPRPLQALLHPQHPASMVRGRSQRRLHLGSLSPRHRRHPPPHRPPPREPPGPGCRLQHRLPRRHTHQREQETETPSVAALQCCR
ncbi:MAG: Bro-N domain-containing protein [Bacteroidaceae bacterium]|nr:Bro-N domain-containing protein [Bacteroidaceae bacterium]